MGIKGVLIAFLPRRKPQQICIKTLEKLKHCMERAHTDRHVSGTASVQQHSDNSCLFSDDMQILCKSTFFFSFSKSSIIEKKLKPLLSD